MLNVLPNDTMTTTHRYEVKLFRARTDVSRWQLDTGSFDEIGHQGHLEIVHRMVQNNVHATTSIVSDLYIAGKHKASDRRTKETQTVEFEVAGYASVEVLDVYPVSNVRLELRKLAAFGVLPLVSALIAFAPLELTAAMGIWVALLWNLTYWTLPLQGTKKAKFPVTLRGEKTGVPLTVEHVEEWHLDPSIQIDPHNPPESVTKVEWDDPVLTFDRLTDGRYR